MPQNHQTTKVHKKNFTPLPQKIEQIGKDIVDSAYIVHKNLGPGLLEKVYEVCFCHELAKKGLNYQRQVDIPIFYDGITFEEGLRLDVLVEDTIICELKAVDLVNPVGSTITQSFKTDKQKIRLPNKF